MEIIKTFYSFDKTHRSSICRRSDGLYDYFDEELDQDYYIDDDGKSISLDYYWREDNERGSITDSIENAEKILKEDFNYNCFEALCVDELDDVQLKNGIIGKVVGITGKGDYIIAYGNDQSKEEITVSIGDIIKVF